MRRKTAGAVVVIAMLALVPVEAAQSQTPPGSSPPPTVMMVIDTSGSMAGTRIQQAKEALTSAVGALAPAQPAGLRSYAGECGNRGILRVPIGTDNRDQLRSSIAALSAGGGTPTPDALLGAAGDLSAVSGPRTIVLVSDGESTCGDPCPTAEAIKRDQGIDFKVQTVGFQTSGNAENELACIARVTGGQYFPVDDEDGLADAIHHVIRPDNKFVYLAFGDSYQSGEGVGNSFSDTQEYRSAYENGSNYPSQVGPQENTYTGPLSGDSCHRAMANYAKLNRDRFELGAAVVLIDRTCSGATIEPSNKPPIVGKTGSAAPDPTSQVAQAIERLRAVGLQPSDVDLVTVGMGGNDAKFGEIVAACLFPNLIRELLRSYPDPPREIEFIAGFVTCERLDDFFFKTDRAINSLAPKETWAQGQLLATFPSAKVLQVNYPNILPVARIAPATCGGIRKGDLDFARKKVGKIDAAINGTVDASSSASNGRIELVDIESSFGPNALCPEFAPAALANAVDQGNLRAEIDRLLNIDGNGDAEARRRVDTLVADYHELKRCAKVHYIPFGEDCDVGAAVDKLKASALAAAEYLKDNEARIFANLISPPGTSETVEIRFDRSRGLFHPNALGHVVVACRVLGEFGAGGCPSTAADASTVSTTDTFNGTVVTNAPIPVAPGTTVPVVMGGFAPGSPVSLAFHSVPIELGSATADANGTVSISVTMPHASPGVHIFELRGEAAGGVDITKQALVKYAGQPTGGDSYAAYFCCFDPEPSDIPADYQDELVDVIYLGEVVATLVPDEDGGVLVEVPLVDPLTAPAVVDIQVRSQRTGKTLTEQLIPTPSVPGLWATGSGFGALSITGAFTTVTGRVHSDGDLTIAGSLLRLTGGVEYVGNVIQAGLFSTIDPPTTRVGKGGSPVVRTIEDFRPGSPAAVAAGSAYTAINPSDCGSGTWRAPVGRQLHGIVYVPCAVDITSGGTNVAALIAAEGPISITGRDVTVEPETAGLPALVSGARGDAAIRITGMNLRVHGTLFAPRGGIQFAGLGGTFRCGAVANTIRVLGVNNQFLVDESCLLN